MDARRLEIFRLAAVALLLGLACATFASAAEPDEIERGKYLAVAADCEGCHTVPGRNELAGGLPLESPLGTIYSTNITPSKQHGIGRYSLEQFSRAVRAGIRRDGAHLYPAMPYASYARLTDRDVKALYVYMMQAVPSMEEPPDRETSLSFPYNMRVSMALWNAFFLDSRPFTADASRSLEWNRGKYLVEGAAHCGECHTPRGFLMQAKSREQFAGAVLGSWYAPNITPDPVAGIGAMSADELFRYLKYGRVAGKAQAGGEMARAVQLSFSRLDDDDIRAMVTYLRSVPAIADSTAKGKFAQGQAYTDVAAYRGVGRTSYDQPLPGGAAQVFAANCATCHGIYAQGSRDAFFPSLFHNSALGTGAGRNLVATILFGINRTTADGLAFMPGFGGNPSDIADFSNERIAALGNYLLQVYGDSDDIITPVLVQEVRTGRAPRPLLVTLVTIGEWAAGIGLLAALYWWFAGKAFQRRLQEMQS